MLNVLIPMLGSVIGALLQQKGDIATKAGVAPDVVEKVGKAVEAYVTQDERFLQQAMAEIDKARQFDVQTNTAEIPFLNLLRGIIRPLITLTAMWWYVYARVENIALQPEDYAIIGGILAFWFGFRPFDKGR
ncbi:MAG: hypothetical protein WAX89_02800 [Alphaproteobacteria bacterium]